MDDADLPRAEALSALVGWNQTGADWRHFLRHGRVVAVDDGNPVCLAATAAVLPFGIELAWISMVLVRPDRRRAGLATALMHWATEALEGTRCIALDATPAGEPVYRRLGFENVLGFTRWRLPGPPSAPSIALRAATPEDWPALLALDAAAFGAPRGALLRDFARRLPGAAWVAEDGSGFALGRDGLSLPQIGPVIARDAGTALALIAAASRTVASPVLVDLADRRVDLGRALREAGGEELRPFTRMARGGTPPGRHDLLVTMAGPELG